MRNLFLLFIFSAASSLAIGADFSVTAPALKQGKPIAMDNVFDGFGCTGKNISPELEWSNAPAGTQSFAITMYDPDAPTGSGWWHWVVFNIPADTHKLAAGASNGGKKTMPKGSIQSLTDFGKAGYGGPCPPPGDKPHHYFFRVFALKDKLPLKAATPAAQVSYFIHQNKLAEAEVMATFSR